TFLFSRFRKIATREFENCGPHRTAPLALRATVDINMVQPVVAGTILDKEISRPRSVAAARPRLGRSTHKQCHDTLPSLRGMHRLGRRPMPEPDKRLLLGTATVGLELHAPISLSRADLRRHLYVIGKTGTGKSTLLFNLMLADL